MILKFYNSSCKVVLLTASEFLRDGSLNEDESSTETSEDIAIINSGDSAAGLENPEAWPDQQGEIKRDRSVNWLNWLKVIGGSGECF